MTAYRCRCCRYFINKVGRAHVRDTDTSPNSTDGHAFSKTSQSRSTSGEKTDRRLLTRAITINDLYCRGRYDNDFGQSNFCAILFIFFFLSLSGNNNTTHYFRFLYTTTLTHDKNDHGESPRWRIIDKYLEQGFSFFLFFVLLFSSNTETVIGIDRFIFINLKDAKFLLFLWNDWIKNVKKK